MINESLKNYEYCKKVRMKLFEGSEFICATEDFTDADENDDNDEDIFLEIIEVLNDSGWYKTVVGYNLHRGLSCGFASSAIAEIEILER